MDFNGAINDYLSLCIHTWGLYIFIYGAINDYLSLSIHIWGLYIYIFIYDIYELCLHILIVIKRSRKDNDLNCITKKNFLDTQF